MSPEEQPISRHAIVNEMRRADARRQEVGERILATLLACGKVSAEEIDELRKATDDVRMAEESLAALKLRVFRGLDG